MIAPTAQRQLITTACMAVLLLGAEPRAFCEETSSPVVAAEQTPAQMPADVIANSVVKVFATERNPDLTKPWAKSDPSEISGSGMVIEGHRILTNAHVVLHASEIQIQGNEAGDRMSATVEAVAPGIDLAVLKLDDDAFFSTHMPLKRASEVPRVKDAVVVYGYPSGGTSLSITKGIVSRIEYAYYNYPVSGLRIQIDAAINHGNSGGPAMVGDRVVGLAFSFLSGAQNIGYIIPTEEIELMLRQVANGGYKGRLASYARYQSLENPAMRRFLKLDSSVHGMVVLNTDEDGPDSPLKKWDVITKIGAVPVDDQGMIRIRDDLRVRCSYLYQSLAVDGAVPITLEREGKPIAVGLPVKYERPSLFPDLKGSYPSYFIIGPMVFSRASAQLLYTIDSSNMRRVLQVRASPLISRRAENPAFDGEEIVYVASPFFASRLSAGYADPRFNVVRSVNGTPIRNLRHLVEVLRDSTDEFYVFDFADRHSDKVVFRRTEMIAATETILNNNGVRSQGSPDMMAAWRTATKP